jgi:hypothetical protein
VPETTLSAMKKKLKRCGSTMQLGGHPVQLVDEKNGAGGGNRTIKAGERTQVIHSTFR